MFPDFIILLIPKLIFSTSSDPHIFSVNNPKIEKSSFLNQSQSKNQSQKKLVATQPSRCANMSGKWSQKSSECRSTPGIAPTRAERGDAHHVGMKKGTIGKLTPSRPSIL
jgi:hypothetical protein